MLAICTPLHTPLTAQQVPLPPTPVSSINWRTTSSVNHFLTCPLPFPVLPQKLGRTSIIQLCCSSGFMCLPPPKPACSPARQLFVLAQSWGSEDVCCVKTLLKSKVQTEERRGNQHERERQPRNDNGRCLLSSICGPGTVC